jgi:lambda family phage portal protein
LISLARNIYTYYKTQWKLKSTFAEQTLQTATAFDAASKNRNQTTDITPGAHSADSELLDELDDLTARHRDLMRNVPMAGGFLKGITTHVVGRGLRPQPQLPRGVLPIPDNKLMEWQQNTKAQFECYADSVHVDVEKTSNFWDLQQIAHLSMLVGGDIVSLLPRINDNTMDYSLRLQLIESERLSNPESKPNSATLGGGIETSEVGTVKRYHISDTHPGDAGTIPKHTPIDAFTESGRPNLLHVFLKTRPGQKRGQPFLTPVVELLYQLKKYTNAELQRAVISSFFTVFVKGGANLPQFGNFKTDGSAAMTGTTNEKDYRLGAGNIVKTKKDVDIEFANPNAPNQSFDQFVQSLLGQIGIALEIPFEILVKHFTRNFSAARAAMLEAWLFYNCKRSHFVDHFCKPIYELWMEEAILLGKIEAPGFFDDRAIRKLWLNAAWVGPTMGHINPKDEIGAIKTKLELNLTTREKEALKLDGDDWFTMTSQIENELKRIKEIGASTGTEATASTFNNGGQEQEEPDQDTLDEEEDDNNNA